MANGTNKHTVAILMLVIAVIGLTATAVTKFYSLKSTVDDLKEICPSGYKHLPIGSIVAYRLEGAVPKGWLLCNGDPIPEGKAYDNLRKYIQDTPDLQGMFLRGAGQNKKKEFQYEQNQLREVGSTQEYATALPTETPLKTDKNGEHNHGGKAFLFKAALTWKPEPGADRTAPGGTDSRGELLYAKIGWDGNHDHNITDGGDEETRPNNYALNFIIKAF